MMYIIWMCSLRRWHWGESKSKWFNRASSRDALWSHSRPLYPDQSWNFPDGKEREYSIRVLPVAVLGTLELSEECLSTCIPFLSCVRSQPSNPISTGSNTGYERVGYRWMASFDMSQGLFHFQQLFSPIWCLVFEWSSYSCYPIACKSSLMYSLQISRECFSKFACSCFMFFLYHFLHTVNPMPKPWHCSVLCVFSHVGRLRSIIRVTSATAVEFSARISLFFQSVSFRCLV